MQNFIKQHNSKVLNKQIPTEQPCNCRNKNNCPLSGDCQQPTSCTKLMSHITTRQQHITDCAKDNLKQDLITTRNHFDIKKHKKETTLSELIWKLKDEGKTEGVDYNISWSIASHARPYKQGS